jgi:hypothetical protein
LTIKQGGVTKGTFSANSNQNIEIDLDAGGSTQVQADWNQSDNTAVDYIKNKPTIPTVPTNVSAFTNDAGYLTQHQSLAGYATENYVDSAIQQVEQEIPTVPTNVSAFTNDAGYLTQHQSLQGYATETWVQQQGYSTFDGDYNSLNNKPTIPAAQVQSDWNATSGMGEILNKPSLANVATSGDYEDLTNKPTIPTVPTNVSAFTNDAGYLTQHQSLAGYATETWVQQQGYSTFSGNYNDLTNKPNIKPDLDLSTLTQAQYVDFYSNYATYQTNYDLNWGGLPILSINSWQPPVEMSPVPVMVIQYGIYGQSALMTGGDDEVFFGVQLIAADGSVTPYSSSMTFKQICHTASYNDLVDKPTIPAAQVQSDWNANSGMGEILNKPSMTAETWTFTLSNNTTVTKTVWLQ